MTSSRVSRSTLHPLPRRPRRPLSTSAASEPVTATAAYTALLGDKPVGDDPVVRGASSIANATATAATAGGWR